MSDRGNLLWFIYLVNLFFANAQEQSKAPTTNSTTTPAPNSMAKPTEYKNNKFMNWLLEGDSITNAMFDTKPRRVEYPGYDGWYNNIGQPELGAVDTPLFRRWPAAYEDGVYKPAGRDRPNPLTLSRRLLSGPIGSVSKTGKNALIVFFGQQVVEEILDAQRPACPPEYFNIPIPDHKDPIYKNIGHTEIPFLRTRYDARTGYSPNNPRQQLNEITPYIDGGLIYGTSKAWSDVLRTYANGTIAPDGQLASSSNGAFPEMNKVRLPMANPPPPINHAHYVKRHYTEPVDRFFKLGNPRGNENPFLLTFGIIWFRWHNHLAKHIKRLHPNWDGETIYNEARKWAIATQQHIIVNDWLFNWIGERLPNYKGYDPTVNPQIDQFFQSAGFRFGHTLVPAGVRMRETGKAGCAFSDVLRTCNNFWMSENALHGSQGQIDIRKEEIDKIIMGMAVQPSEREDHTIVEDLRGNVFGPLEFSRRDLMALNVQRARDHGVPDYNTARRAYGLAPVTKFSDFNYVTDSIRGNLSELYKNDLNNIDIWIGGILETDDRPGELFRKIIMDQFERIRNGDRFWYKNTNNGLFTTKEIGRLEEITFYDVLMSITDLAENDIPKNPFNVPRSQNDIHEKCVSQSTVTKQECTTIKTRVKRECWYAQPVNSSSIENCTAPGTYDYFADSDVSFILTFIGLGTFPLGLIILIVITLNLERKKDLNQGPARPRPANDDADVPVLTANEWLGFNMLKRPVLIILNRKLKHIQVKNKLGYLSRALDFRHSKELMVFLIYDLQRIFLNSTPIAKNPRTIFEN
ncbi:dual oxidase [Cephus cinctus]|uniref:Dual oxidase n=1 Tax=Cephus cinctus TaxID=211228 RepID=A0AAJ7BXR4_CEPCN|nr:dual oxidase [Cephus cinctus]